MHPPCAPRRHLLTVAAAALLTSRRAFANDSLAAAMRLQSGRSQASMDYAFDVRPRWPLDQLDEGLTAR